MIEKVSIRNFQSLVDAEAELGVLTVILGANDLGKSAFLRAIKAAASAAQGTDFITYGHTMTRVAIVVDGHELVWEKGTNVNRYILDGITAERVGRQVPSEVSELLALGPVEFDKNLTLSLNFADQDDPPFLIPFPGGLSTSHVAKVLGDLTNLNILYRAVGEADVRRRRSEGLLKTREHDLEITESQMVAFVSLPQRETRLAALESLLRESQIAHQKWLELSYKKNELDSFRSRYATLKAEQESLGPDLTAELGDLMVAVSHLAQLSGLQQKLDSMRAEFIMIQSMKDAAVLDEINAKDQLDEVFAELEVCPLCHQVIDVSHASAHAAA